jgi:antitoxin ParD1/3/4
MNINLTPELEQMVRQKMRTGQYASECDVVLEALRLMDERDRLDSWRKEEIRAQIAAGVASLRAGRSVDGDAFFEELEREMSDEQDRTA